jgi:hypothetical protein
VIVNVIALAIGLMLVVQVAHSRKALERIVLSLAALTTLHLASAEAGDDPEKLRDASLAISAMINGGGIDGDIPEGRPEAPA